MSENNVEKKEGFNQICVWPGTVVGSDEVKEFVQYMNDNFGVRVQYLEEIKTLPDTDSSGIPVKDTGGRNDLFFAVHKEDVGKFSIPRLQAGIRWIEDVLSSANYSSPIYPERVKEYMTWEDPVSENKPVVKPVVKLAGEDGNVFAIIGRVSGALKKAGLHDKSKAYTKEVMDAGSYDEALQVTMKYVDVE